MTKRSRPGRSVKPDEEALWQRVVAKATPHTRTAPAPVQPTTPKLSAPRPETPKAKIPENFGIGARSGKGEHSYPTPSATPDSVGRLDRRTGTKIARGRLRPEGRIDLHGMTLAEAQPALTGFVLSAQSSGKRMVLVITGKGRADGGDGPIPVRTGVLRHQVPIWLKRPPLSSAVIEVAEAQRKHGGSGAYYVFLRRAR